MQYCPVSRCIMNDEIDHTRRITLARQRECMYDEREERKKYLGVWALGHDYMEGSPVDWQCEEGFAFQNSISHSTSRQRRQATMSDQRRKAPSFVVIVCAHCTLEPLRGVKRDRELQQGQSLKFEPHIFRQWPVMYR